MPKISASNFSVTVLNKFKPDYKEHIGTTDLSLVNTDTLFLKIFGLDLSHISIPNGIIQFLLSFCCIDN